MIPAAAIARRDPLRTEEKYLLAMVGSGMACIALSVAAGFLGALYYIPPLAAGFQRAGLTLVQLRPLHTTFASAWIFLGAAAGVCRYLWQDAPPGAMERARFKAHMICWGLAGLGALATLSIGITTGREYLDFHPSISLLILVGWLLFAWNFFARVWRGFWARPVYVYMWASGILFFIYTFLEGHAWLLPGVRSQPVADLQIQWKSCGSLVASFNQMVYGCLIYMGERLSGDKEAGHSKATFTLFGIGLLNSFTNSAHHTYHLPQWHYIKWVAFVVSMLEIVILVRVFQDLAKLIEKRGRTGGDFAAVHYFIGLSKIWNGGLLTLAILISIPPLNGYIHGTHVVMAHAMGSELAIDTYILLAAMAFILSGIFPKRETVEDFFQSPKLKAHIVGMNLSLIGVVGVLLAKGLGTGYTRFYGLPEPAWSKAFPVLLAVFGAVLGYNLLRILARWLPLLLRPAPHRSWRT